MITAAPGIVLSGMRYRENGKILRLFTKDYGILSVMAHGVYKRNSALLSVTEWFSTSYFDLDRGRNFYYLRGAELINLHYSIRNDYRRIENAQLAAFFLLRSIPEEHRQSALYELYARFLHTISNSGAPVQLGTAFLLQAGGRLGYQPTMYACTSCGNREIQSMRFSHRLGGIVCEKCHTQDEYLQPFSKSSYMNIYTLLRTPLEEIGMREEPPSAEYDQNLVRIYLGSAMGISLQRRKKRK